MNALVLAAQWVTVPKKKKGKQNPAHVRMQKSCCLPMLVAILPGLSCFLVL